MTTNTQTPHQASASKSKIVIRCECGARGKVPARYAGRRIACSGCGAKLRVPLGRPEPRRSRSSAEQRIVRKTRYQRDHAMEAHVAAIGLWNRALGLLGLIGGGLMLVGGVAVGGPVLLMALVYCGLAAGLWTLGHGLVRFKGWARALTGASAGLALLIGAAGVAQGSHGPLAFLIGGGWNAAVLWALFSPRATEVFSPEAARARGDERARYWTSPFCWAPLLLGVLLFALRTQV